MKSQFPFLSYRQQMFLKTLIERGWSLASQLNYAEMTLNALIRKKMLTSIDASIWSPSQLALEWYQQTWAPNR